MLALAVVAGSLGCTAKVTPSAAGAAGATGSAGTSATTGRGGSGTAGTSGAAGTGGGPIIGTDAGSDAACTPSVTCMPAGGQYCGKIGNGCKGGSLECGACSGDSVCNGGLCVGGPSCQKKTCTSGGSARYCGTIGDGCGMSLDCGGCATGEVCTAGVCVKAGCVPLTCTMGTTRYCGTIGDGCGGTLTCGDCAAGSTCGGGGVPGVCAATNCTTITCNPMGGGQYCGRIGNGCGGVLDCPSCPGGAACGTGAQAGVCPGMPGTGVPCTGLACQINKCTGMPKTTVKGTVYDPGGKLPLYNVMVYVPNAPLDAIVEGVTCDKCGTIASGQPVASALTDASGNFTMPDVPVGTNIPVVIQTGKWRRQVTLPMVKACQDNVFSGADMFRLPKNQSEGHLPKIAMTRGKADSLECLMRRIGISDSE
ncbi:MAG TPA: carboxypeptidase-like regulatory domain-containing protein, partial [Polyangia bacterium]